MTNLELAKQQGNQCGPNLIDAQKTGEIDTGATNVEYSRELSTTGTYYFQAVCEPIEPVENT